MDAYMGGNAYMTGPDGQHFGGGMAHEYEGDPAAQTRKNQPRARKTKVAQNVPPHKQCRMEGCLKYVRGGSMYCAFHGGGRRCNVPNCGKIAQPNDAKVLLCATHCREKGIPYGPYRKDKGTNASSSMPPPSTDDTAVVPTAHTVETPHTMEASSATIVHGTRKRALSTLSMDDDDAAWSLTNLARGTPTHGVAAQDDDSVGGYSSGVVDVHTHTHTSTGSMYAPPLPPTHPHSTHHTHTYTHPSYMQPPNPVTMMVPPPPHAVSDYKGQQPQYHDLHRIVMDMGGYAPTLECANALLPNPATAHSYTMGDTYTTDTAATSAAASLTPPKPSAPAIQPPPVFAPPPVFYNGAAANPYAGGSTYPMPFDESSDGGGDQGQATAGVDGGAEGGEEQERMKLRKVYCGGVPPLTSFPDDQEIRLLTDINRAIAEMGALAGGGALKTQREYCHSHKVVPALAAYFSFLLPGVAPSAVDAKARIQNGCRAGQKLKNAFFVPRVLDPEWKGMDAYTHPAEKYRIGRRWDTFDRVTKRWMGAVGSNADDGDGGGGGGGVGVHGGSYDGGGSVDRCVRGSSGHESSMVGSCGGGGSGGGGHVYHVNQGTSEADGVTVDGHGALYSCSAFGDGVRYGDDGATYTHEGGATYTHDGGATYTHRRDGGATTGGDGVTYGEGGATYAHEGGATHTHDGGATYTQDHRGGVGESGGVAHVSEGSGGVYVAGGGGGGGYAVGESAGGGGGGVYGGDGGAEYWSRGGGCGGGKYERGEGVGEGVHAQGGETGGGPTQHHHVYATHTDTYTAPLNPHIQALDGPQRGADARAYTAEGPNGTAYMSEAAAAMEHARQSSAGVSSVESDGVEAAEVVSV